MTGKCVIIHEYNPEKTFYEVAVKMSNVPGTMSKVLEALAKLGVNVLSGYSSASPDSDVGEWCSFVEANGVSAETVLSAISGAAGVLEVNVLESKDGLIMDIIGFPVTWNTGERAVLIGQERLAKMLDRLRDTFGVGGRMMVYQEGLSTGEGLGKLFVSKMGAMFVKSHLEQVLNFFTAAGACKVQRVEYDFEEFKVKISVTESLECVGHSSKTSYSEFLRGNLVGMLSVITGERLMCEETRCVATGADVCEFKVSKR